MNKVLSKALAIFLYVRLILSFFYVRSQGDLVQHFLNCCAFFGTEWKGKCILMLNRRETKMCFFSKEKLNICEKNGLHGNFSSVKNTFAVRK